MLSQYFYGSDRVAEREPVLVIDVGCSYSGVGSEWNIFGSALRGVGFDPLEAEVDRLNSVETRPNVRYEAGFVGLTTDQRHVKSQAAPLDGKHSFYPNPFLRSSGFRAAEVKRFDHVKELFNSGEAVVYSKRHVSIDEWAAETNSKPKILKVDVDGTDFEVLLGASRVIENSILALHVECMFQSNGDPYANNLSNIETFLRERGFSIFDILPFRYSRAALPGIFDYDLFASTTTGQFVWADVLFIRDMAGENYESAFGFEATPERIIATACVMEQFGLQDCALELMQHFADRFPSGVEEAVNTVAVPAHLGPDLTYRQYIARFEEKPEALYPSALKPEVPVLAPVVAARPSLWRLLRSTAGAILRRLPYGRQMRSAAGAIVRRTPLWRLWQSRRSG